MEKKIILGSLIVVILFILMPSIPAIQNNVIKDKFVSDISNDLDLVGIKKLLESMNLEGVKHPILFLFVYSVVSFWWIRMLINLDLATEPYEFPPGFTVTSWLFFLRCVFFMTRIELWLMNWEIISDHYGWGWQI